uniref:Fibrillin-1-like isoform X4 n=1 Tax=Crassostrea virginica TaxID=6565 RepID=A0A8B8B9E9_CRAVI|nr:fibrillin-1-like isoform X4 [Crassostrea virginica]
MNMLQQRNKNTKSACLTVCTALHQSFDCSYSEFNTFLQNESNCPYHLAELMSVCKQDQQSTDHPCVVLLSSENMITENSTVNSANVTVYLYGVRYSFDLKPVNCPDADQLPKVKATVICEHKTAIHGRLCENNDSCNRNREICRKHDVIDKDLCIPIRSVFETCDNFSTCEINSECKEINNMRTCQCQQGYEFIDNQCMKGGLALNDTCVEDIQCTNIDNTYCQKNVSHERSFCRCIKGYIEINSTCFKGNRQLYESCDWSEQCTGSNGPNQCRYLEGIKICHCQQGYSDFDGSCLKANVSLGKPCYIRAQCDGIQNSTICDVPNGSEQLTCICNTGFIESNNVCLTANKELYEECQIDDQCSEKSRGVCREVFRLKLCLCDKGYVEDKESLKCRKAEKKINDTCKINEQCNGTENANTCVEIGSKGICTCNQHFEWIEGRCLEVGRKMFEPCDHPNQCNGSINANVCKGFGNKTLCYCNHGYLESGGKCIQGNKILSESCEADIQCSGTDNAGVCGKDGTCSCPTGYLNLQQNCFQVNRQIFESCNHSDQCTGTENATVCKEYGSKMLCYCAPSYLEDKGACRLGDQKLDESCEIHLQCSGTKNAGFCGDNGTCLCNNGFIRLEDGCVQGNVSLGQPCTDDSQCTGNEHGERCLAGKCDCKDGFELKSLQCLPAEEPFWMNEYRLLLIAGGGGLGTIVFFITTMYFALKRRTSRKMRLNCHHSEHDSSSISHYPMTESSSVQQAPTRRTVCSEYVYSDLNENGYSGFREVDAEKMDGNIYDTTQAHSSFHGPDCTTDVYAYNHLHEQQPDLSNDLYDSNSAVCLAASRN